MKDSIGPSGGKKMNFKHCVSRIGVASAILIAAIQAGAEPPRRTSNPGKQWPRSTAAVHPPATSKCSRQTRRFFEGLRGEQDFTLAIRDSHSNATRSQPCSSCGRSNDVLAPSTFSDYP